MSKYENYLLTGILFETLKQTFRQQPEIKNNEPRFQLFLNQERTLVLHACLFACLVESEIKNQGSIKSDVMKLNLPRFINLLPFHEKKTCIQETG